MYRRTLITATIFCFILITTLSAEVKNRDKPAIGEWDFSPVKVWEVDRAGEDVFGLPFTLRVSNEGRLYIFDMENGINYIFDSAGGFKISFARGGEGPGEIIGQERTFLVDDKVIITGMNGIHYFTKDGDYLRKARQEGSGLPLHLFLNEEELIAAPLTGIHTPEGRGKILLQNLELGTERVLAEFSSFRGGVGRSGEYVFDMIVVGLSPLLTMGQDRNRIYWGMSDEYLIHVTDLEGNRIDSFSINRKPTRFSKRMKRKYFERQDLPADALNQIIDSFPEALTHFHRIEMHNGLIYVFVPELDLEVNRGRIRQIDIFSPEGEYLYRAGIELEKGLKPLFSPLDNLVITGDFMYAACEKEDDTLVIVKYRIDLPGR
ncbi:hypothetical protein ACFLR7_04640 [Acidobacteriota bacterium]